MSSAGRAVIVTALRTVDGLDVHTARPGILSFGTAWPVWRNTTSLTECVGTVGWSVFVAVPAADEASVVELGEPLIDLIVPVLLDMVDAEGMTVEPVAVTVADGGSTVVCLHFSFTAPA